MTPTLHYETLDPNNGSLKHRLSRNGIDHMHDKMGKIVQGVNYIGN